MTYLMYFEISKIKMNLKNRFEGAEMVFNYGVLYVYSMFYCFLDKIRKAHVV